MRGYNMTQMRQAQDNFSREMDMLCRLSHPYVLRMFGICTDNLTSPILVTELA